MFESTKKKTDDKIKLGNNTQRLVSKVYFKEELNSEGFHPTFEFEKIEKLNKPNKLISSHMNKVFDFSSNHPKYIDIMRSKEDEGILIASLNKDKDNIKFREYLNVIYSKYGGNLIPSEYIHDINVYQTIASEYDNISHPTQTEINLGKRILTESKILQEFANNPFANNNTIAKKLKIPNSKVSEVLKCVIEKKELPYYSQHTNRLIFKPPPISELRVFLESQWAESGCISTNWKTFLPKFRERFPHLSRFKDKTLSNHLRKLMGIRSMVDKRLQTKSTPVEFLTKQLALGLILTKLHFAHEKVIYFDQSSIQLGSFKKSSLGTTQLAPLRATPNFPETIFFISAITMDGFVAIQFLKNNATTSNIVQSFIIQVMNQLQKTNKDNTTSWFLVMDNAGYHKTADIKELCTVFPLHIIYTVPCSPFLNLIEDFFLGVKKVFKSQHYEESRQAIELLCRGIKETIVGGFEWIMRKHVGIMHQKLTLYNRIKDK